MTNEVDQDRVADTTRNASILDMAAYKARADNPARAATTYADPQMRMIWLFALIGLFIFFVIFRRA